MSFFFGGTIEKCSKASGVPLALYLFTLKGKNAVTYVQQVKLQLERWQRKILKPPGIIEKSSKKLQTRVNQMIPLKARDAITVVIKGLIKGVLFGLEFVPKGEPQSELTLQEQDEKAEFLLKKYKRIAAAEGAGTGAGGIILGIADFPALIAIKMKFLFELAHVYGFSTRDYRERLFLLYVFQLAFSSQEKRPLLFHEINHWNEVVARFPEEKSLESINWEQFQQEYRDAIDFRKMLQMIPGLGAVVGAWANYGLLEDLGGTAMNCYRLRILNEGRAKT